jgi:hypothetical protein
MMMIVMFKAVNNIQTGDDNKGVAGDVYGGEDVDAKIDVDVVAVEVEVIKVVVDDDVDDSKSCNISHFELGSWLVTVTDKGSADDFEWKYDSSTCSPSCC